LDLATLDRRERERKERREREKCSTMAGLYLLTTNIKKLSP